MVFTVRLILVSITALTFCTTLESAAINPRIPEENTNATTTSPQTSKNVTNIPELENAENKTTKLINSTTNNVNESKTDESTVSLINTKNNSGNNNNNSTDDSNQARTENARSLDYDISKYISPEFHNKNNVFNLPTSPENEKFINSDFINKNSKNIDLSTTITDAYKPTYDKDRGHDFFDKYPSIDNETPIFKPSEVSVEDLIKTSKKNNADTTLNLLKYTNIINDKIDKEKENRFHLNFDSIYNDTQVYDEKTLEEYQPITSKSKQDSNLIEDKTEEIFTVNKRGSTKYLPTSEKPSMPTIAQRNISFKNNLIKNTIPEDIFVVDPNEQSVQENVVYPIIISLTTSQPSTATMEMFEVTDEKTEPTPTKSVDTSNNRNNKSDVADSTTQELFYEITTEDPTTTIEATASSQLLVPTTAINAIILTTLDTNTTSDKNVIESTTTSNTSYLIINSFKNIPEITTIDNVFNTTTDITTSSVETTELMETTTALNPAAIFEDNNTTITKYFTTSQETTINQSNDESKIPNTTINSVGRITENETTTTGIKSDEIETTTNPLNLSTIYDSINTTKLSTEISRTTTTIKIITTPLIIDDNTKLRNSSTTDSNIIKTTTLPHIITTPPEFKIFNKYKPLTNSSTENTEIDDENEEFGDDEYNDLQIKKPNQTNVIDDPEIHAIDVLEPEQIKPVIPEISDLPTEVPILNTTKFQEISTEIAQLPNTDDDEGANATVIAIIISSVGGICLAILVGLLIVMRRRQRRFNYGQRCTPVSLDSYSMDNVSVHNSVRRKARLRGSKRSYGNPAFDDTAVSHTMGFQQLVKFVLNVDEIKSEFDEVPLVTARMNELPDGCDTKNRYANVIPLPESRVFLNTIENDPTSDFINANYVTGPKGVKNYYIACQAPMQNTVNDFWRMIWEQQSKVIIMLTHLFENGVEKCIDYLPPSEVLDCHRLFGDYQVTLKKREVKDKYIISSLQLKNMVSNSWREVTHLWYLGWPEKGIPSEENSLIAFLIEARSFVKLVQNNSDTKPRESNSSSIINSSNPDVSPVVVHCSPGTGRTGTVIACDIAIREFELKRVIDIPKIVYRIRRDRASSVQTKDQYLFIYKVISLYATKLAGGALDTI